MTHETTEFVRDVGSSDGYPSPFNGSGDGGDKQKIEVRNLTLFLGETQVLSELSIDIHAFRITAVVGTSGSGKSVFLRTLSCMHEHTTQFQMSGHVLLDGEDIYTDMSAVSLHQQIGFVFQRPNLFPLSIFDNIAYGVRVQRRYTKREMRDVVEDALQRVALWNEVKDRLKQNARSLSEGQQKRLCLARALAVEPEVLLMDDSYFALDPCASHTIEELIGQLREHYTIIIATSIPHVARRIADTTGVFSAGTLVEWGPTQQVFSHPKDWRTEAFLTGRLG